MKISIITINYNNAEGLRQTLESIKVQLYKNYELLLIDGNSTDNSIEVIKEYGYKYVRGCLRVYNKILLMHFV